MLKGTLQAGDTLTVTATLRAAGSRGSTVRVRAFAGDQTQSAGGDVTKPKPNYVDTKTYTVSVPVKPCTKGGGFQISVYGHHGHGQSRGLVVDADPAEL